MNVKQTIKLISGTAIAATFLAACSSTGSSSSAASGLTEGSTMVALVNIHADAGKGRMYALNYQLPMLIPVCSEVTLKDVGEKEIELEYKGRTYSYEWDKHTRGAGVSLAQNFKEYFGAQCDQQKIDSLSKVDKEGIRSGQPKIGMSKTGIQFAMGKPPVHATPSLESNTWMYWLNRWKRQAIEFDENGKVKEIRL